MNLPFLLSLTFATLIFATAVGQLLRFVVHSAGARAVVANANVRIGAWWVLCGTMGLALMLGSGVAIAVFAAFSSLALLEFAALAEDRPPRYFLCILTAVQYAFVWTGSYPLFAVVMPLAAVLCMRRAAGLAWGLIVCVYGVSHAPALLTLHIAGYERGNATLLFYFLLVVQSSDVFQYCWGKLAGRHPIAPRISPNKTVEGFVGGILTSTAVGTVLYRATPFQPWQAACLCLAVTLLGFAGGLVMSSFKRRHGVKDFGTLVSGHGGVLDRLDSICFSAPVFYYVVKYLYA